ncbi:MAG: hypothetical protein PHX70_06885 [Clostridium sp.]|nr:hypothetical protein [Clostridium sp.]
MNKFKIIGIFIFFILVILIFSKCSLIKKLNEPEPKLKEPVVYLYSTVKQRITVKLNFNGKIIYSYPKYNEGWKVIANPNGNIVNLKDEKWRIINTI